MKLSAALIMKNEEEHLPRLLKSLQGKFDEIVVVDTGSTDRSIEIAKEYGCRVYEKEWNGFADARNYAISKCTGDWIWHFDADFELEDEEFRKFLPYAAKFDQDDSINAFTIYVRNFNGLGILSGVSSQTFIHKNSSYVYWQGNIHETLNIQESLLIPVYINHYGYQHLEILYQKAWRNLELIKKDILLARQKNSKEELIKKLFYLFQSYGVIALYKQQLDEPFEEYIQEFMKLREEFKEHRALTFFAYYTLLYIAHIFVVLHKEELAKNYLQKAIEEGYEHPDILFNFAKLLYNGGKKKEAKEYFIRCLERVSDFEKNQTEDGVVDNIDRIWDFIEHESLKLFGAEDIETLYQIWKKRRSAYFAVVLVELIQKYQPQKLERFVKKIEKVYSTHERVLLYLLKTQLGDRLQLAKKIVELNPKNFNANKILGIYFWKLQEYKQALHYFINIPPFVDMSDILPQFIESLRACGFEKEAKKLQEKLKK